MRTFPVSVDNRLRLSHTIEGERINYLSTHTGRSRKDNGKTIWIS